MHNDFVICRLGINFISSWKWSLETVNFYRFLSGIECKRRLEFDIWFDNASSFLPFYVFFMSFYKSLPGVHLLLSLHQTSDVLCHLLVLNSLYSILTCYPIILQNARPDNFENGFFWHFVDLVKWVRDFCRLFEIIRPSFSNILKQRWILIQHRTYLIHRLFRHWLVCFELNLKYVR